MIRVLGGLALMLAWVYAWTIVVRTHDPWVIGATAYINVAVAWTNQPPRAHRPARRTTRMREPLGYSQPEYEAAIKALEAEDY